MERETSIDLLSKHLKMKLLSITTHKIDGEFYFIYIYL
jgi:hypothetical protein